MAPVKPPLAHCTNCALPSGVIWFHADHAFLKGMAASFQSFLYFTRYLGSCCAFSTDCATAKRFFTSPVASALAIEPTTRERVLGSLSDATREGSTFCTCATCSGVSPDVSPCATAPALGSVRPGTERKSSELSSLVCSSGASC